MIFSGLWRSCMEVPLNATCFAVVGALVKSSCFVQIFPLDLYLQSAQVFFPCQEILIGNLTFSLQLPHIICGFIFLAV